MLLRFLYCNGNIIPISPFLEDELTVDSSDTGSQAAAADTSITGIRRNGSIKQRLKSAVVRRSKSSQSHQKETSGVKIKRKSDRPLTLDVSVQVSNP